MKRMDPFKEETQETVDAERVKKQPNDTQTT